MDAVDQLLRSDPQHRAVVLFHTGRSCSDRHHRAPLDGFIQQWDIHLRERRDGHKLAWGHTDAALLRDTEPFGEALRRFVEWHREQD